MRAVDHWRKVRTLKGYLAGRVQQLKDQASPSNGRWKLESGQTLQSAIDQEFRYAKDRDEKDGKQ